jgi:hypothetical protein
LTRDATRLVALALALNSSGSRVEDLFWEEQLRTLILKLLRSSHNVALEAALDHLAQNQPDAHEVLLEQVETLTEWTHLEKEGIHYDALLIVAPIVAWTRYAIPVSTIPSKTLQTITTQLQQDILAPNVKLALMPWLISVDQMPHTFSETWQWLQQLGTHALNTEPLKLTPNQEPENAHMLADTRYLVGTVVVPQRAPIFRWQENAQDAVATREACLSQWATQMHTTFAALLPGCSFECLLPNAYYLSHHEANRQVRPLALRATVAWLEETVNLAPSRLRAVVAGCGEEYLDEYRIAFTARNSNKVIYGCVWLLQGREETLSNEDDRPTVVEEITALLKELGILEVRHIPGILPAEYCEDCGTPYFPNPLGELVHPELPDEVVLTPTKFH